VCVGGQGGCPVARLSESPRAFGVLLLFPLLRLASFFRILRSVPNCNVALYFHVKQWQIRALCAA
jgi:hypothetical protein